MEKALSNGRMFLMKAFPSEANVPREIQIVVKELEQNGFSAYLIGGCVRDLLLERIPKDWDVTTDALPEQILQVFAHSHYDNDYGTVRVVFDDTDDPTLKVIEVTTFRQDIGYSDNRRPDQVSFSKDIHEDLKRRDFTVNALALRLPQVDDVSYETFVPLSRETLVDDFEGIEDLQKQVLRAVGDPVARFHEDALRMLRAVRFASELGFILDKETHAAIEQHSSDLAKIAVERVREEFNRIILSSEPQRGIEMLHETGLLAYIVPELLEAVDIEQNQAHAFDVWEHLLRALQLTADKNWPLEVRLAALFHDIAKPATRRFEEKKQDWSFYGHEVVGSRVTKKILERLKYPKDTIDMVTTLVRWHMFFSDTEEITLSAVRRMIRNVGKERIWDLMNVRVADRIGMGRPKENPYRLRKYKAMVEEALHDPISVGMLAINGEDLIKTLNLAPGPKIGAILHALLEEVLENPKLNTKEYLLDRSRALNELPDEELATLGAEGKEKRVQTEQEQVKNIRKKYWVE
jgi:poly(A) polymerase/tRNA nucleotidyltransferase (CCA-adding enzyme)